MRSTPSMVEVGLVSFRNRRNEKKNLAGRRWDISSAGLVVTFSVETRGRSKTDGAILIENMEGNVIDSSAVWIQLIFRILPGLSEVERMIVSSHDTAPSLRGSLFCFLPFHRRLRLLT